MDTQADDSPHSPQLVGNVFVEQYYQHMFKSPELVRNYYLEESALSRPGFDGAMITATSPKAIDDVIQSLENKNSRVEILTADSQASYNNGVIVLVTGIITGVDKIEKQFSQTFFLAPQNNGFFVLNDLFRYNKVKESKEVLTVDNADEGSLTAPVTPHSESVSESQVENQTASEVEEQYGNAEVVTHSLANGKIKVQDEITVGADSHEVSHPLANGKMEEKIITPASVPDVTSQPDPSSVIEETAPIVKDVALTKSYASIVNALKDNTSPFQVRNSVAKPVERMTPRVSAAPETTVVPTRNRSSERNNVNAAKEHSIFVAKLPMDATVDLLRSAFEKFGPIKRNGIQVRSYREQQNCFGFVEFESVSSVKNALEASPILLGEWKVPIEAKRADNDGKFAPRRDRFRGNNFSDRGNFNEGRNFNDGRGYGRNGPEGGFSGQGRPVGRLGDVKQKIYQNGGGMQNNRDQQDRHLTKPAATVSKILPPQ